jgi:hypothetical protein
VSKDMATGLAHAAPMLSSQFFGSLYRPHADLFQALCALHKAYPPTYPAVLTGICHERQTIAQ